VRVVESTNLNLGCRLPISSGGMSDFQYLAKRAEKIPEALSSCCGAQLYNVVKILLEVLGQALPFSRHSRLEEESVMHFRQHTMRPTSFSLALSGALRQWSVRLGYMMPGRTHTLFELERTDLLLRLGSGFCTSIVSWPFSLHNFQGTRYLVANKGLCPKLNTHRFRP